MSRDDEPLTLLEIGIMVLLVVSVRLAVAVVAT